MASPLVALSLVPPPAEVPPASPLLLSPVSLELPPLADSPPDSLSEASLEDSEEPSVEVPFAVVDVVEVEVVCTAAFSALVSVGGVMSGVLFGTASLTLLPPPQAQRATGHSSRMLAASKARADGRRAVCAGCTGGAWRALLTRFGASESAVVN